MSDLIEYKTVKGTQSFVAPYLHFISILASLKLSSEELSLSFQMFDFILRNFVLFFWDFNRGSSKKEDLQMVVLKSGGEMIENVRGGDHY